MTCPPIVNDAINNAAQCAGLRYTFDVVLEAICIPERLCGIGGGEGLRASGSTFTGEGGAHGDHRVDHLRLHHRTRRPCSPAPAALPLRPCDGECSLRPSPRHASEVQVFVRTPLVEFTERTFSVLPALK